MNKKIVLTHVDGTIFGIGDSEKEARQDAAKFWDYEWTIDEALASTNYDKRIWFMGLDELEASR